MEGKNLDNLIKRLLVLAVHLTIVQAMDIIIWVGPKILFSDN